MSKNDASEKLGQKLLQGWTMLGEVCQVCSVKKLKKEEIEKFV